MKYRFFLSQKQIRIASKYLLKNVPYYAQWESPTLVDKIIRGEISASKDPRWKKSGATSPAEYEFWAKNLCGMACLKMILTHRLKINPPLVTLGKECAKFGGYQPRKDRIDGLFYQPLIRFIRKQYWLKGRSIRHLTLKRIIKELASGNFIIASVSPKIRKPQVAVAKKGGHLILLLGYDLAKQTLTFHNPSGDTKKSQKYAQVTFSQFKKFFAGKGVLIYKNQVD